MTASVNPRVRHATRAPGHPVLRAFFWAAAAISGFGLVFAQTYTTHLTSRIHTKDISAQLGTDRPPPALPPEDGSKGRAVNILLMGSDDRSGANAAIGGVEAGQRADTTLILHISADRSRVEALSIPRDSMVKLAKCERSDGSVQRGYSGMFNEAFANGARDGSLSDGAACAVRTVESLTDIRIDHFAVIDMVGFTHMIDAVGGVPMCIPRDIKDRYTGLNLKAGPQVLDGLHATQYVRARHGTGQDGSDLGRIDNQQVLLKNLARKVMGSSVLLNPVKLTDFVAATADSLTMDPELADRNFIVGLAFSLRGLDTDAGLVFATVPVKAYAPNPNRVEFASGAAKVFNAMATDQPIAPFLDKGSNSPANTFPTTPTTTTTAGPSASASPETAGPVRETTEEILAGCSA